MKTNWSQTRYAGNVALCVAVVLLAALVSACGSSGGGSFTEAAKNSKKISSTIPASGCGAVTVSPPKDPDGVLAKLPANYQDQYAGYSLTVRKSPWANFKPDHGPPYKVGMSFAQLSNPTQSGIYNSIKRNLESNPDIEVTAVTTASQLNIPQQLQQYASLRNQGADLIIVEPLTDAFGDQADKAGQAGVPTVSVLGSTDSKYSVNVAQNAYGQGALVGSMVLRQVGSGNVLYVHGIASTAVDADAYNSYKAALKNCPKIKQVGEIAGAFVPSTAKGETLKFLASHPEQIDAVIESGGMAPGIIDAFKQAGRPIPLVADTAGLRGSLGYWLDNDDQYHGFAIGFPPARYGAAIASVVKRMLAGRGVKISDVTQRQPLIEDLSQWAKPEWNLDTPGGAEGPEKGNFLSEEYLAELFNDPRPAK